MRCNIPFEWLNTKVLLEINKKILIEKIVHWINSSKFNEICVICEKLLSELILFYFDSYNLIMVCNLYTNNVGNITIIEDSSSQEELEDNEDKK